MNRFFPLLVLLMALPASAGDSEYGKKVFDASCSSCHVAGPVRNKGAAETDNLALWLKAHSSAELRQWVKDPVKQRADTRCDPRQLKAQDFSDLISYLRSAQAPATPAPAP